MFNLPKETTQESLGPETVKKIISFYNVDRRDGMFYRC
jgi:hypothetical protein